MEFQSRSVVHTSIVAPRLAYTADQLKFETALKSCIGKGEPGSSPAFIRKKLTLSPKACGSSNEGGAWRAHTGGAVVTEQRWEEATAQGQRGFRAR